MGSSDDAAHTQLQIVDVPKKQIIWRGGAGFFSLFFIDLVGNTDTGFSKFLQKPRAKPG